MKNVKLGIIAVTVTLLMAGAPNQSLAQAVFLLLIDEDSIGNGNPPNFFSDAEVNDDIAEVGLRTQMPFFAANVGERWVMKDGLP